MINIQNITLALGNLESLVNDARLPSDKKQLIDCFAPLLKELIAQFKADENQPTQGLHFAAIYGLVRIHSEQIKKRLVCYQSNTLYLRSFIETDASQDYHKALVDFLNKYENDFQNYRRSDEAKKYIVYTDAPIGSPYDPDFHEGFKFGPEMSNEQTWENATSKATSLAQLEKRIFAYTYFEMYEHEVKSTLMKNTGTTVVTNAAALIFAPVALPLTLAGGAYFGGYLGKKGLDMKTALEGSAIRKYEVSHWRTQIKTMLSSPTKSKTVLEAIHPQTQPQTQTQTYQEPEPSSLRKMFSSFF